MFWFGMMGLGRLINSDQQPKKKELQEIKRFDRKKDETEKRLKKNYSSLCTP